MLRLPCDEATVPRFEERLHHAIQDYQEDLDERPAVDFADATIHALSHVAHMIAPVIPRVRRWR